jgi:hypothetical protein
MLMLFTAAFDDAFIYRFDQQNLQPKSKIDVRYVHGPKQRVIHDIVTKEKNLTLPVVSIEQTSLTRDPNRVVHKHQNIIRPMVNDNSRVGKLPTPIPMNMDVKVSIIAKYKEDVDQIVQNFAAVCNPYFVVSWKVPEEFGFNFIDELRIQIEWNGSISYATPNTLSKDDKYRITADTSFTIKGWIFPPTENPEGTIYVIHNKFINASLAGRVSSYDDYPALSAAYTESETISISAYPTFTNLYYSTPSGIIPIYESINLRNDFQNSFLLLGKRFDYSNSWYLSSTTQPSPTASEVFDVTSWTFGTDIGNLDPTTAEAQSIYFKSDGLKMYAVDYDSVYEYTLLTPWDIKSIDPYNTKINTLDLLGLEDLTGMFFHPDGDYLYVTAASIYSIETVFKLQLTTPWNISGGLTVVEALSTGYTSRFANGLCLNSTGDKLYLLDRFGGRTIREYVLSVPWSIESASLQYELPIDSYETFPEDININSDNSRLFIIGRNSRKIHEFNLSAFGGLSSSSYVGSSPALPIGIIPTGFFYNDIFEKAFYINRIANTINNIIVPSATPQLPPLSSFELPESYVQVQSDNAVTITLPANSLSSQQGSFTFVTSNSAGWTSWPFNLNIS